MRTAPPVVIAARYVRQVTVIGDLVEHLHQASARVPSASATLWCLVTRVSFRVADNAVVVPCEQVEPGGIGCALATISLWSVSIPSDSAAWRLSSRCAGSRVLRMRDDEITRIDDYIGGAGPS
jgi:hypothetical protein